jgi:hypothetical protein
VWRDIAKIIGAIVLLVLIWFAFVIGIATTNTMRIGQRTERLSQLERAVRKDDLVLIEYRVAQSSAFGPLSTTVHRWSRISLADVRWSPLNVDGTIPYDTVIEDGSPPDMPSGPGEEIPILSKPETPIGYQQNAGPLFLGYVRRAAGAYPLSLCPDFRYYLPALIAHKGNGSDDFSFTFVRVSERRYRTWWAIPIRIALLPFALALDVITSPLQLLFWFSMSPY